MQPAPPSSPSVAGAIAFYGFAALVVGGAVGVAFGRNLLRSALLLLATLTGVAGLYLLLGADFVGVTQILVYVGGVLVLLLFAVLFTTGLGEGAARASNPASGRATAIPIAALLAAGAIVVAVRTPWPTTEAVAAPTTQRIGDALLREYLFPFELVSILLLVALVGAIVLARRAAAAGRWRRDGGDQPS